MKRESGSMEILKLVLISLALVFAVSAFAMILLKSDGADAVQIVRTIKLPGPPPPSLPPADEGGKDRLDELCRQEIAELKYRQKRADAAVAKLRAKYEKDGKLPDRIVLETPTSRPKPLSSDQDAMPNTAPLTVYPNEKRIEFDAQIVRDKATNMPIEVLITGPRGKLHEALLKTFINPYDLWQALALLGLKQSYTVLGRGHMAFLEGDRVIIEVEYKDKDGKLVRKRLEDLIYHYVLNTHMPYNGWVYVGSHFGVPHRWLLKVTPEGEVLHSERLETRDMDAEGEGQEGNGEKAELKVPDDVIEGAKNTVRAFVLTGVKKQRTESGKVIYEITGTEGKEFFYAAETESIANTWHSPISILDNPLAEGGDDSLYDIYEGVVPPRGTKLRIIMTVDEKYNKNRPEAQPLWSKERR